MGDELRNQGKDAPARIADEVADRVERVGEYLQRTDGETLLGDAEDLARRNPWPVALGGLAVGFAASRLLRASSRDRHRARSASSGNGSTSTGSGSSRSATSGALPQSTGPKGPTPKRVPSIDDGPSVPGASPGAGSAAGVAPGSVGSAAGVAPGSTGSVAGPATGVGGAPAPRPGRGER